MKINQIIKSKRLELNLTQEQIAKRLGITTPAVNKWEKGLSYPDITLLPPFARLLETDLNTLLSFQEDLSKIEVSLMINGLFQNFSKENFEHTFKLAMEKYENILTVNHLFYIVLCLYKVDYNYLI